jgi:alcohol dehydrogenase (cytochrome c)
MGVSKRMRGWAAVAWAVTGVALTGCGSGAHTAAGALAACPTSGKSAASAAAPGRGSWPYPNGTISNTRDMPSSTISSANVSTLTPAWAFKLTGQAAAGVTETGSLAANPIVQDGVVYLQDLHSNVYAVALRTGRLIWECPIDETIKSGPGPNGVAVADGLVFGQTPTTAFALNAATGRRVWANAHLLGSGQGTFGIQPEVADGRVYLASQLGFGPGGGVLLALNASSGRPLWKVHTVVGGGGHAAGSGVGSGGAWETPLVGADGSVTYGIGNPYQSAAEAIAHPSRALYTDSDLNLDAATGRLRWYYQGVPDDFKDYDMQTSPIRASIKGAPAVIGSGKMGYVYAINAETGRLIWKKPVGEHNGHDNDSVDALEHRSTLRAPYTILPGSLGGVLSNLGLAGNSIYVVTCDLPFTAERLSAVLGAPTASLNRATGEMEALDLTTGKVRWETKLNGLPFGAATVSNDLVLTTLYSGILVAINRETGALVYQHKLPTSTDAPIAIAGGTLLLPAGGPTAETSGGHPQLVAYTVR